MKIQEAYRTPNRLDKKKSPCNIIIKTQNIQEIWYTVKRLNLRKIVVEEGEDLQLKGPGNIFNKIIEETFPT